MGGLFVFIACRKRSNSFCIFLIKAKASYKSVKNSTFVPDLELNTRVSRKFFLYTNLVVVLFLFMPSLQAAGKDFIVVIDPGHGGRDPGALGATAKEKDINLAVALKLGREITHKHKDVRVVYTRDRDKFVELDERAHIANRNKADLFISIHTNAVRTGTVRGTETYTLGLARTEENLQVAMRENAAILLEDDYMQKYEGFDPNSSESYIIFEFMQNKHMEQSVFLASEIQKGFVAAKRLDRGVRQAGFLVLRKTSMPSVLIELGYISNKDEERYMKSAEGQNKLAEVLYHAFIKFKREWDRKQGALNEGGTAGRPQQTPQKRSLQPAEKKENTVAPIAHTASTAPAGKIVYKVQILASDKKITAHSKQLKGYKNVSYYVENGMYKYTYGESTSLNEINKVRRRLLKDFKDAFVVSFKDGKKIK
ncbi:N-acetylmuramoyl-L-alanine amidase [Parabacteroides sp. 52]|nr:N-acetylmuramoyl-L-alanine amidase [Parabacteroides sp. PM5-20]NDV55292.1 N-acetylmuramoyl-L-alanine amidase [Parabacteroides sp. 52]